MAINIKRILNKQNLTGAEVGKALVANTAAAYENLLRTRDYGREPRGIFGQAEMDRMVRGLKSNYDIDTYNSYVSLNNYIAKEQGFVNAYHQQALLGYYKIMTYLNRAIAAEHSIADARRAPLIMTRKQYEEHCNAIMEKERAFEVTYLSFLAAVYKYYYGQFKDDPKKKNPLSAAIKASKKKTIKNQRITDEYIDTWGIGHYETADGISSDDCTQEEWTNIVKKILLGREPEEGEVLALTDFTNTEMSSFELEVSIRSLYDARKPHWALDIPQVAENLKWVEDEAPEEFDGDEILESLDSFYPQIFEYGDIQEEVQKQLEEFASDFPELYEALKKEAARLLPAAKSFSIEDFEEPIATWGELADKNILNYKTLFSKIYSHQITEQIQSQSKTYQGMWNGIAIIRDEDIKDGDIDKDGHYIQPEISIEGSILELGNDDFALNFLETAREEELKGALREIYAFNAIIDLITEITGVDVSIFSMKPQTDQFEQQVEAFNNLIETYYARIKENTLIFEEEDRKRRERYARTIFPLLDLEELKPTPEAIAETRAYISDLTAFNKNTPAIIEMLKRRGGEADE